MPNICFCARRNARKPLLFNHLNERGRFLERRFRHIDLSLLFKIQSCKMCKPFVFGGQTYVVVSAAMFKHHDCSPFLLTRGWGVPSKVVSVILRFPLLFKIQRSKMCKPLVFVCQTYVSVPAAMLKNHYCSTI